MVGVGWGVFPDPFFKLHQESTSLLGVFRDFQKSPMPKPAQLDCRGPAPPDSELEPCGSKREASFHLVTDSGRCPSPKGKVDVPAPEGGYGLPNQSPNLAPGLTPPQPLHSRPEESQISQAHPAIQWLQDRPHPQPGRHSMPVDDVLLWQLPVESWHQSRER